MKCEDCRFYVGDVDETTDCYQESCPYIGREDEDEDWKKELIRRADKPRINMEKTKYRIEEPGTKIIDLFPGVETEVTITLKPKTFKTVKITIKDITKTNNNGN